MLIRPILPDEIPAASALIRSLFDPYLAPDYTPAGREFFWEFTAPEEIRHRLGTDSTMLVAEIDGELVGLAKIRDRSHIACLFVAAPRQGQGVGKRLLSAAIAACRPARVTVHASTQAVEFYLRMGFVPDGPARQEHGIHTTPMICG